jgi:hypothetical protein
LVAALGDLDGRVRRRAALALCRHGDRATALLRRRLGDVSTATPEAVWVLARIASRSARRLLAAHLRELQIDAERTVHLLDRIAGSSDRAHWSTLELCLRDHRTRIADVVLAALSPAIEAQLFGRVRDDLQGGDRRSRASAFELIAAGPAARLAPGAVALLRHLLFEEAAGWRPGSDLDGAEPVLDQAMASMGPWVRRAAARTRRSDRPPDPRPASTAGTADPISAGDHDMALDAQEFERIVALKRMPLFRYVPFEIMAEVARSVQAHAYLAGDEVIAGGTGWQDLLVLETGALAIGHGDGAGSLEAPGCFGEVALVGERIAWPRITALEDSRVSFLRATIFQDLCREHPELAIELSRLLARRLREACEAGAR